MSETTAKQSCASAFSTYLAVAYPAFWAFLASALYPDALAWAPGWNIFVAFHVPITASFVFLFLSERRCRRYECRIERPRLAGCVAALVAVVAVQLFSCLAWEFIFTLVSDAGIVRRSLSSINAIRDGYLLPSAALALAIVVASLPVPLVLRMFCRSDETETRGLDAAEGRPRDHWDALGSVFADENQPPASADQGAQHGAADDTQAQRRSGLTGERQKELRWRFGGGIVTACVLTVESVLLLLQVNEFIWTSSWFSVVLIGGWLLGCSTVALLSFAEARRAWLRTSDLAHKHDPGMD